MKVAVGSAAAIALALAGVFAATQPASQSPDDAIAAPARAVDVDAQMPDEEHLFSQEAFNLLADELRYGFPGEFAAAEIVDAGRAGTVSFRATAPEAARTAVAELPGVTLVEDVGYTERDLEEASLALFELGDEQLSPYSGTVSTHLDATDDSFHLVHRGASAVPDDVITALERSVALAGIIPPGFDLVVSPGQDEASMSSQARPSELDGAASILVGRIVRQSGDAEATPLEGSISADDGCVVLRSDVDGTTTPIAWPEGTSMPADDPGAIALPNGTVRLGEEIGAATGWAISLAHLPDDVTGVEACAGDWDHAVVISELRGIAMQE